MDERLIHEAMEHSYMRDYEEKRTAIEQLRKVDLSIKRILSTYKDPIADNDSFVDTPEPIANRK